APGPGGVDQARHRYVERVGVGEQDAWRNRVVHRRTHLVCECTKFAARGREGRHATRRHVTGVTRHRATRSKEEFAMFVKRTLQGALVLVLAAAPACRQGVPPEAQARIDSLTTAAAERDQLMNEMAQNTRFLSE